MAVRLAGAVLAGLLALGTVPAAAQTVVLVRHGEKAHAPGDPDPALSEAGQARAAALAEALGGARVTAVLTSQFRRTRDTAAPVAAAAGVAAETVAIEGRDVAGQAAAVARRLAGLKSGETAVVVGHSNTLPALIAALGGPAVPELQECEYDRLFVLVPGGERPTLVQARYGASTAGCAAK